MAAPGPARLSHVLAGGYLGVALLAGIVVAVVERLRERFADEPATSAGPLGFVVPGLVVPGLAAGPSVLGGAGTPSAARDGCAYPLRGRGNVFTCVSATEYRERGAWRAAPPVASWLCRR